VVATELFLARDFETITIADVAAAAGVSRVTMFKYFERMEDLLFDRLHEALDVVRSAVRDRAAGTDVVDAIRELVCELAAQAHPLSGLAEKRRPVHQDGRGVTGADRAIARVRAKDREHAGRGVDRGRPFHGNLRLTAALLVAAYRTVAVDTVRRRLAGEPLDDVATAQRKAMAEAFDAVAHGLRAAADR
jgi:AcrR family transcriptional regulator